MIKNKYLLIISLINYSIFAMDDPAEIPPKTPGIFLKEIVSEYKNPIRVSQMPIKRQDLRKHEYEIDERSPQGAEPLAVVFNNQVRFCKRVIKTESEYIAAFNESYPATIIEIACLQVEDLLSNRTDRKSYVWIHKFIKDHNNKNRMRGSIVNRIMVEKFDFDPDQPSQTLVTLRLTNKDRLMDNLHVESKTIPCEAWKYKYYFGCGGPP